MVEEVKSQESLKREFFGLVEHCFGRGYVIYEKLSGYASFYELRRQTVEKAGCWGRIMGERDRILETRVAEVIFFDKDMGGVCIGFMNQFQPIELHVCNISVVDQSRKLAEGYEKLSRQKATIVREY
ncbi:MAG: hypothetical protein Q7R56_00180 [Nanoarchaeota archaeon]|nr:hypothetical protein [Nanoarchaeota archaeon]